MDAGYGLADFSVMGMGRFGMVCAIQERTGFRMHSTSEIFLRGCLFCTSAMFLAASIQLIYSLEPTRIIQPTSSGRGVRPAAQLTDHAPHQNGFRVANSTTMLN